MQKKAEQKKEQLRQGTKDEQRKTQKCWKMLNKKEYSFGDIGVLKKEQRTEEEQKKNLKLLPKSCTKKKSNLSQSEVKKKGRNLEKLSIELWQGLGKVKRVIRTYPTP